MFGLSSAGLSIEERAEAALKDVEEGLGTFKVGLLEVAAKG